MSTSSDTGLILPSQQFASRLRDAPEYRLMVAVLENALHCLEKHRFADDRRSRQLFNETRAWILTDESQWLYSFASICAALDLNVAAVRRRLFEAEPLTISHPSGGLGRNAAG